LDEGREAGQPYEGGVRVGEVAGLPAAVEGAEDSKSERRQDSEQYVAPSVCLSQDRQNWCSQAWSKDMVNEEARVTEACRVLGFGGLVKSGQSVADGRAGVFTRRGVPGGLSRDKAFDKEGTGRPR
jgi:hypothetical protein